MLLLKKSDRIKESYLSNFSCCRSYAEVFEWSSPISIHCSLSDALKPPQSKYVRSITEEVQHATPLI